MLFKRPRGTQDILPPEVYSWHKMEDTIRSVCAAYGYEEVRTPIFEYTELFNRGVGETTDIVEKEMYTFSDRSGRSLTLRPEGTAPVVRAYLENKLYAEQPVTKLFYIGPMFRYNRPQAGRLRQFHQFGVEFFGSPLAQADAEVISLCLEFYKCLGLKEIKLLLNSIGCKVCRPFYRKALQTYFKAYLNELCPTCQGRFERNPLRILDCKSESCRQIAEEAPLITDYLCEDCKSHFEELKGYLKVLALDFSLDPRLVRGLDYYNRTAFEVVVEDIGTQSSLGGGGRYDDLVEECGGEPTPAVGFGIGLERTLLALQNQGILEEKKKTIDVFVVKAGKNMEKESLLILYNLRREGFKADQDYSGRSLKAQLKTADHLQAPFSIIIGEDELQRNKVVLRDMQNGSQQEVLWEELMPQLKRRLEKDE